MWVHGRVYEQRSSTTGLKTHIREPNHTSSPGHAFPGTGQQGLRTVLQPRWPLGCRPLGYCPCHPTSLCLGAPQASARPLSWPKATSYLWALLSHPSPAGMRRPRPHWNSCTPPGEALEPRQSSLGKAVKAGLSNQVMSSIRRGILSFKKQRQIWLLKNTR